MEDVYNARMDIVECGLVATLYEKQERLRRRELERALAKTEGNKNRAARLLGVDPRYFRILLKRYRLA